MVSGNARYGIYVKSAGNMIGRQPSLGNAVGIYLNVTPRRKSRLTPIAFTIIARPIYAPAASNHSIPLVNRSSLTWLVEPAFFASS